MSKNWVKFVTVSGMILSGQLAFAKTIDTYAVSVNVQNTAANAIGQGLGISNGTANLVMGVAELASGISCTSTLIVEEKETLQNKVGGQSEYDFSSSADFSLSELSQPQSQTSVTVNPNNINPMISVTVQEYCSAQVPEQTTCPVTTTTGGGGDDDSDGSSDGGDDNATTTTTYVPCTQMETETLPLSWSCDFPANQFPQTKGASNSLSCNPPNNDAFLALFSDSPIGAMALSLLHSKQITVNLQNEGRSYHFVNYNCPQNVMDNVANLNSSLDKILSVSGGVKTGNLAGNNINYDISINGGPVVQKDRSDGITNFDILYCQQTPGAQIDLTLNAEHKKGKVIQGTPDDGAPYTEFNANDQGISKTIDYQAPGSLWGHVNSQVNVQMAN
jgi:hypothetical protein